MLAALKFPEWDVNSDTKLTLNFQFFPDPATIERAFSHLSGPLFKFFSGSYQVYHIVDQMANSGLAQIYVCNENNVDVFFFPISFQGISGFYNTHTLMVNLLQMK